MTPVEIAGVLVALAVFVLLLPWVPLISIRIFDGALRLTARLLGWRAEE